MTTTTIVILAILVGIVVGFVLFARRTIARLAPAPEDVAAPPQEATVTPSGLAYKVLTAGPEGGMSPGPQDSVTVHYTGWQTSGRMFDSSVLRGQPATFRLDRVIRGWTEGVGLMVPGDKWRFWIPAALAYGERPRSGPGGMLVFDVELLRVGEDESGNS